MSVVLVVPLCLVLDFLRGEFCSGFWASCQSEAESIPPHILPPHLQVSHLRAPSDRHPWLHTHILETPRHRRPGVLLGVHIPTLHELRHDVALAEYFVVSNTLYSGAWLQKCCWLPATTADSRHPLLLLAVAYRGGWLAESLNSRYFRHLRAEVYRLPLMHTGQHINLNARSTRRKGAHHREGEYDDGDTSSRQQKSGNAAGSIRLATDKKRNEQTWKLDVSKDGA